MSVRKKKHIKPVKAWAILNEQRNALKGTRYLGRPNLYATRKSAQLDTCGNTFMRPVRVLITPIKSKA